MTAIEDNMSTSGRRTARSWLVSVLLGAAFAFISTTTVFAQCELDAGAAAGLKTLRSADDKARVAAAGTLVSGGLTTLPAVMAELKTFKGAPDRWSQEQQLYFISITDIIRTVVSNSFPAIKRFRECDDETIIKPLVLAAKSVNPNMRVNATLILGNTVDNSTVCHALHQLRDPQINSNINGRANLLGVTLAVASYAYRENKKAIEDTLDIVQKYVSASQQLTQTQKLISDIRVRVAASSNANASLPPELSEPCGKYDYASSPKSE